MQVAIRFKVDSFLLLHLLWYFSELDNWLRKIVHQGIEHNLAKVIHKRDFAEKARVLDGELVQAAFINAIGDIKIHLAVDSHVLGYPIIKKFEF